MAATTGPEHTGHSQRWAITQRGRWLLTSRAAHLQSHCMPAKL